MKDRIHVLLLPLGMIACLGLFALVERRPVWFANTTYLGGFLALQIAFVGLTHYEAVFFPLLMGTFLWAGSSLPFSGTGMALRWLFLAVGALGGFVIWIKNPRPRHFWRHPPGGCAVRAVGARLRHCFRDTENRLA